MADRVGQQFGQYHLIRLLGRGGFAEVYLGEHLHLGTQSAIKILHTRLTDDDVNEFRTEARTIARLVHPHIVRVFDFGIDGETPFLVMDYASNGTIRKQYPKGVPLPLPTILSYVKQVADALQYAHDEHFIHRDIKPENLLIGRRQEVLLSDFGIALIAQTSRSQSMQDVAGTASYMAPEQFQGKPRPASDQYAFAVMVYEWFTGSCPFRGSFTEIASQHLFVPPPALREKVPTIQPGIEQVVLTALSKDPKERFGSVQEFAAALEQASQTQPRPTGTGVTFPSLQLSGPPNSAASFPPPTETLSATSLAEPFSASNLPNSENISSVPKTGRNSAITSHRQGFHISRTVLFIGLALLIVVSGTGLFAIIHANQLATFNATAIARASTTAIPKKTVTSTPVHTPTASATNTDPYPPGTWNLALYDPLSQPSYWSNGSSPSFGGSCQFSNGAYHISQSKLGNFFCTGPANIFSSLTVEVKMTIITGDCGGIWLRGNYSAATPAYFFGVCQNGQYGLYLYRSPSEQTLVASSSVAIHTGLNQSNMIAIVANGSNFDLYVNHQKINSASDSFVSSGEINLSAEDLSNSTEVAYSDARVWTP